MKFVQEELCSRQDCEHKRYKPWFLAIVAGLVSLTVLGDPFVQGALAFQRDASLAGFSASGLITLFAIWIATVVICMMEPINNIFVLIVNSVGLPAFVLTLAKAGAF